jgi:hypothetical protein
VDRLFDDLEPEDEHGGFDPSAEDELQPSFDRYVGEGITLLEEWLRNPY